MASAGFINCYTWPAIQLAIHTSMYVSDLLKLTWEEIDTESRLANLHNNKNGGPRAVPLSRQAMKILAKL